MKYKADYQWPAGDTSYQTASGANNYGIYDMAGNVGELCNDWSDRPDGGYYRNSPAENPTGPTSGSFRVVRGGSWVNVADPCRVADRSGSLPGNRHYQVGFRIVLDF